MHARLRIDRRAFLQCCSAASMGLYPALSLATQLNSGGPVAPKPAHHPAKAKNLIFVFLTGGFSHVDTFDYKPRLLADSGKRVFGRTLRDETDKGFYLIPSPFQFTPHGKSGLMISDVFRYLGERADDLCV